MSSKQIFRKVALERLSSPEQLDQLITVTTPLGWLALFAIGGLLLTAVLWGVYGSIPTKVQGQGIILKKEGMVSIQAQTSGRLTTLSVAVDDIVEKGQVIARIQQDALLEDIQKAELELQNLERSFDEKKKVDLAVREIRLQELQQTERNQRQQIENLKKQIESQLVVKAQQEKLLKSRQNLAKEGIITQNAVLEVENEIVAVQQQVSAFELDIAKVKNQLNNIALESKKLKSAEALDELSHSQKMEEAKLEIRKLQKLFAENSQIVSSFHGRVLELPHKEEELITTGSTIVVMEKIGDASELEVQLYFSPLTGKQIQEGMQARISPSFIKREEFGFMEGVVSKVDKYPSTLTTLVKTLQNDALAQMLTANAAPIKVTANLLVDAQTASGYKWSSRGGPPVEINSGTICFGEITIKEQAPISLVIPILKKYVFGIQNPA